MLRPHAVDAQQRIEKRPLAFRSKAIQRQRVFTHDQAREQLHVAAFGRQPVQCRKRHPHEKPHAVHVHDRFRAVAIAGLVHQGAVQMVIHRRTHMRHSKPYFTPNFSKVHEKFSR